MYTWVVPNKMEIPKCDDIGVKHIANVTFNHSVQALKLLYLQRSQYMVSLLLVLKFNIHVLVNKIYFMEAFKVD